MSGQRHRDLTYGISPCRVMAMTLAIGAHLMLVILLLRPSGPRRMDLTRRSVTASAGSDSGGRLQVVEWLRRAPSSTSHMAHMRSVISRVADSRARHSDVHAATARRPRAAPLPPSASRSAAVARQSPNRSRPLDLQLPPGAATEGRDLDRDGGFRDRLRQSAATGQVRGVPGTDRHVVQGIQLVDPRDQGIGAVMRTMQRLFGITSHACIDVDVWSGLSPRDLAAKHITPDQLQQLAERYHCNEPPGLHF